MKLGLLFSSIVFAISFLTGVASAAAVVLTEADSDKSASITVGQELRVELKSNATTGYSWKVASAADKILQDTVKSEYVADAHAEGVVGAGGRQIWHFKGSAAGTQILKFEYRRPWEKDVKPAQTATFEIVVK